MRERRVARADRDVELSPRVLAREVGQQRARRADDEARASTTDADARVMKMPDGGFRPAYNIQFATDPHSERMICIETANVAEVVRERRLGKLRQPGQGLAAGNLIGHERRR